MSTGKETVAYILDQLTPLSARARAMFCEHGLYREKKIVALIYDDTLFVKPTAVATDYLSDADLVPPYSGAKDYYAVPGDRFEDREWLQALISRTAEALPPPKKRKQKSKCR